MRRFIGIGPGRCGTETLVRFVRACGYKVTHEGFNSPWYKRGEEIVKLGSQLKSGWLQGEVNCRLFPHVNYLKGMVPNLGIVCLHRTKEDVVKSYMANIKPMFRPVDRASYKTQEWPARYPMIDAATAEQSIGFWWEMCEAFMEVEAKNVFHLGLHSGFSSDERVKQLYEFLEIPASRRVIPEQRIYNSTAERAAMTTEDHANRTKEMSCV